MRSDQPEQADPLDAALRDTRIVVKALREWAARRREALAEFDALLGELEGGLVRARKVADASLPGRRRG